MQIQMQTPKTAAIRDFHRARMQASIEAILARVRGDSAELLSYDDVARRLHVTGQTDAGIQTIPIAAIVGSVGRYNDFSRTFLPKKEESVDRWAAVKTAAPTVTELPAIDVYQIGDAYFVIDGNHRVSIARQQELDFIDARVIQIRTRVPLSADDNPGEIIIKAEYADFLARTGLDRLRPTADLTVSEPGQYAHLENLIEVHRYFVEMAEAREMSDETAVARWYDDAYLPLVGAIREQGILRYFPGRTETDFYVWLSRHRARLQNELGWHISPDVAVARLTEKASPTPNKPGSLAKRVVQAITGGDASTTPAPESWAEEKLLARYSQTLFADVLLPVSHADQPWPALEQALQLSAREQAQLCGLHVVTPQDDNDHERLVQQFDAWCRPQDVHGHLALEAGSIVDRICERAALTDLVVWQYTELSQNRQHLQQMLARCTRPLLLVNDRPAPLRRVLLVYDGRKNGRDALFVAAYMGEQWQTAVAVLGPDLSFARDYLSLHEVDAAYETGSNLTAQHIHAAATAHSCDLILLGNGRRQRDLVMTLMSAQERPLFICP